MHVRAGQHGIAIRRSKLLRGHLLLGNLAMPHTPDGFAKA